MILGITGGTGCGKTTLLNLIQARGGLILDCDAIYHELLQNDTEMLNSIQDSFPDAFEANTLNRKKLGSIVFSDPKALETLNRITHQAVRQEVLRRLSAWNGHAAIDAIALIESGLSELCDITVAVTAPYTDRVNRLMKRDAISEEYAKSRIAAQKPESWFQENCDFTISNGTDWQSFTNKCLDFLDSIGIMNNGHANSAISENAE